MPKFVFTFGYGQNPGIGFYTTVEADTERDARNIMNEHYQNRWSFCYASEEKAGVQRFNLKEVPLGFKFKESELDGSSKKCTYGDSSIY
jgi:hypothetical protein